MKKTLLVTGGSRGIGAATAHRAAANNYAVAVNYRENGAAADKVVAAILDAGGKAIAIQADISEESDIIRLFDETESALGSVDALVNSAGTNGGYSRIEDFDASALKHLMQTNVIGTMLCSREAARRMSSAHGGSGGAIVNVTSMAGTIGGRPGSSHYAASKAAIDSFTKGFAKEVAIEGIRVNAVRPGVTLTDMTAAVRDDEAVRKSVEATIAMNRVANPDEIAAPIVWLLSDEASFISGCRLDASGGGFVISANTKGPSEDKVQPANSRVG